MLLSGVKGIEDFCFPWAVRFLIFLTMSLPPLYEILGYLESKKDDLLYFFFKTIEKYADEYQWLEVKKTVLERSVIWTENLSQSKRLS